MPLGLLAIGLTKRAGPVRAFLGGLNPWSSRPVAPPVPTGLPYPRPPVAAPLVASPPGGAGSPLSPRVAPGVAELENRLAVIRRYQALRDTARSRAGSPAAEAAAQEIAALRGSHSWLPTTMGHIDAGRLDPARMQATAARHRLALNRLNYGSTPLSDLSHADTPGILRSSLPLDAQGRFLYEGAPAMLNTARGVPSHVSTVGDYRAFLKQVEAGNDAARGRSSRAHASAQQELNNWRARGQAVPGAVLAAGAPVGLGAAALLSGRGAAPPEGQVATGASAGAGPTTTTGGGGGDSGQAAPDVGEGGGDWGGSATAPGAKQPDKPFLPPNLTDPSKWPSWVAPAGAGLLGTGALGLAGYGLYRGLRKPKKAPEEDEDQ